MKVAVIINASKPDAVEFSKKVIDKLISLKVTPIILSQDRLIYDSPMVIYKDSHLQMAEECDVVITVGGDGTIIHAGKHAAQAEKPILGINFGRVGFVAAMEPNELDKLDKLLTKDYICEKRMLLNVKIYQNGSITERTAINDAVVSGGSLSRIVDLHVLLNDKTVCDYRADGIIVSTPTGSTAYSLSAGGPVIRPDLNCILLTPICPHTLFSRSLIFGDDDKVTIEVAHDEDEQVYLTIDGQSSFKLQSGDKIEVEKYSKSVLFIKMEDKNFYTVLNDKLNERGI